MKTVEVDDAPEEHAGLEGWGCVCAVPLWSMGYGTYAVHMILLESKTNETV